MNAKEKQKNFDLMPESVRTNLIGDLRNENIIHNYGNMIIYYDLVYYQVLDTDYLKLTFFDTEIDAVNYFLDNFKN